jgi:hypothetical protein
MPVGFDATFAKLNEFILGIWANEEKDVSL